MCEDIFKVCSAALIQNCYQYIFKAIFHTYGCMQKNEEKTSFETIIGSVNFRIRALK